MKNILLAVSAVALTGCANINNEANLGLAGMVAGGLLMAPLGAGDGQAAAIIFGSVVGGMIGADAGRRMDYPDLVQVATALELAKPGQMTEWENKNKGVVYQLTPGNWYRPRSFESCRDYALTMITVNGSSIINESACRHSNGSWVKQYKYPYHAR